MKSHDDLQEFLRDVMRGLGFPSVDIESYTQPRTQTPTHNIVIDDASDFVTRSMDVLHALNHVSRRFVEAPAGERLRIAIDINNFHKSKIDQLTRKAEILASRAVQFEKDFPMDPLSSYERLIVHNHLLKTPAVSTESRGEGDDRHVVIRFTPAGKSVVEE